MCNDKGRYKSSTEEEVIKSVFGRDGVVRERLFR